MLSVYNDLILNSFITSVVLSMQNEYVLASMLAFGDYDKLTIFVLVLVASFAGFSLNYWVGRLIMREPMISIQLRDGYAKICRFTTRYLSWCLLFSWIDVYGPFVVLFAGFLKVPTKIALSVAILGKAIYYAYAIYTGNVTVSVLL